MASPAVPPRHVASATILLLGLALAMWPWTFSVGFHGDEFTNLSDGLRLLHGAVIYRDFFEVTAPLSHWIAGWTFLALGPSLLAGRLSQAVAMGLSGWLLYRLARWHGIAPWLATLPAWALVLALYRTWPGYSHHWMALPFLLGSLVMAMRAMQLDQRRAWVASGVLAACDLLSMQSDGLVLLMALAGTLVLGGLLGDRTFKQTLADAIAGLVGFSLPLLLAALYFAGHHALGLACYDLWVWPLTHYKTHGGFNDVPYASELPAALQPVTSVPGWYGRVYYLIALYLLGPVAALSALASLGGQLMQRLRTRLPLADDVRPRVLLALLVVGLLMLVSRGRADLARTAIYAVPALVWLLAGCERWRQRFSAPGEFLIRWLPALLYVAFVATGAYQTFREVAPEVASWSHFRSPDERIAASPVFAYIRAHSDHGSRLVAMPFGGIFYFYGRSPATRYSVLLPLRYGYNDDREFRQVWDEIATQRPKFVVVGPYGLTADNLGEYLRYPLAADYHRVPRQFQLAGGPVVLFERAGSP